MLLKSCFICPHHEIRKEEGTSHSFCQKENCWSRYSRCLARKAVEKFIQEDRLDMPRGFSALSHVYGCD